MKNLFFIIFLVISISVFSQESHKECCDTGKSLGVSQIISQKNITYYGWDFRYLIYNDHHFQDQRESIYKITKGWISYFDEQGYGTSYIEKIFKDKYFTYDPRTIQILIKYLEEDELIDNYDNQITDDSIATIVSNYPVKGEGLGLIFIADEVNKNKHSASAYATIFDISSKTVLKTIWISGYAGEDYGLVAYYGNGFIYSIRQFEKSYKKLTRALLKSQGSNN